MTKVADKQNIKIKNDSSENKSNMYEKYQGSNNLTKKPQHMPMRWQNRAEQNVTAVAILFELLLRVGTH